MEKELEYKFDEADDESVEKNDSDLKDKVAGDKGEEDDDEDDDEEDSLDDSSDDDETEE